MRQILIIIFCFSSLAIGAVENKELKDKKDSKDEPEKRLYSEKKFREEVLKEVTVALKKLGEDKIVDLSNELLKKENKLKVVELEITKKEEELDLNKVEFEKRVKGFRSKQSKLIGCLDDQDKLRGNRIRHMVDVVSGMKPDTAAQILSVQDSELAIEILAKLDAAKVSKIFNLMKKEISARLQKQYMNMKR